MKTNKIIFIISLLLLLIIGAFYFYLFNSAGTDVEINKTDSEIEVEELYDPVGYVQDMPIVLNSFLNEVEEIGELNEENQESILKLVQGSMESLLVMRVFDEYKEFHLKVVMEFDQMERAVMNLDSGYGQNLINLKSYYKEIAP